jgi:hypothetical protein
MRADHESVLGKLIQPPNDLPFSSNLLRKSTDLNVSRCTEAEHGVLDFVFLQLAAELFVGHVICSVVPLSGRVSLSAHALGRTRHASRNICTRQHEGPKL